MHSYAELAAGWRKLACAQGFELGDVACKGLERTLLHARIGDPAAPRIALSAGVHGDEPAAPWALLSIVQDGLLDKRFSYWVWPCTNPSGYARGTRANADGVDVNRSFSGDGKSPEAAAIMQANSEAGFTLSLDLHEDFEAGGFYCFERCREGLSPIGSAVVRALDEARLPVQHLTKTYDLGYPASTSHALKLRRGVVNADAAHDAEVFAGSATYSVYMFRENAQRALTIESPLQLEWEQRIAIHRLAVIAAIEELSKRTLTD